LHAQPERFAVLDPSFTNPLLGAAGQWKFLFRENVLHVTRMDEAKVDNIPLRSWLQMNLDTVEGEHWQASPGVIVAVLYR
jgi:hypothetical protein